MRSHYEQNFVIQKRANCNRISREISRFMKSHVEQIENKMRKKNSMRSHKFSNENRSLGLWVMGLKRPQNQSPFSVGIHVQNKFKFINGYDDYILNR